MKVLIGISVGVLILFNVASAEIDTVWSAVVESEGWIEMRGACFTLDGGVVSCGAYYNWDNGDQDVVVVRTNAWGEILWTRTFGDFGVQDAHEILPDGSGGFLLFGFNEAEDFQRYASVTGIGPGGDSLWTTFYRGADPNQGMDAAVLPDGNSVIVGSTVYEPELGSAIWITAVNDAGDSLWGQEVRVGVADVAQCVTVLSNGHLLIGGQSAGDSPFAADGLVFEIVPGGDVVWSERFQADNQLAYLVRDVAENSDGDLLLCGLMGSPHWWSGIGFVSKLESDGELIWSRLDSMTFGSDYTGLLPDAGGGCLVVGTVWADFGFSFALARSYDSDGVETDSWSMPQQMGSALLGFRAGSVGGGVACGFLANNDGIYDGFLLRVGSPTSLSGYVFEVGTEIAIPGVHVELLATGESAITNEEGYYTLLTRVDTTAVRLTSPCVTPGGVDEIILNYGQINTIDFEVGVPEYSRTPSSLNLAAEFDRPTVVTVTLFNTGSGEFDFTATPEADDPDYDWLSASPESGVLPPDGETVIEVTVWPDSEHGYDTEFFGWIWIRNHSCPDSLDGVPVSVIGLDADHVGGGVPERFALHPAYPNPFNAATTLRLEMPQRGALTVQIHDVLGRVVGTVIDEVMPPGTFRIPLNLGALPSGSYWVTARLAERTQTQKIVLIK